MKRAVYAVLLVLAATLPAQASGLVTRTREVGHRDFRHAKKVLPNLYKGLDTTFYCGCRYRGKQADLQSCGYRVRKNAGRARRIEWEHVVPAWAIGHQRQCWQQGGRKHCSARDDVYRKAEGDLHNLVPELGELNNDRSNFRFTVWDQNPAMYGQCRMVVDFKGRRAQPPQQVRGRIARITLYMVHTYQLRLSRQERRLYCIWARTYPVDAWERARDARIRAVQGNSNPFVANPRAVARACQGVR
ncbi:endonuclease [Bordetella petrii]|uniref:Endonuclease n=1 Tax=Bordetella petrii TaxID=94624 RepID=A0ABT7W6H9_9BORD|nr:endonuclease [Bordetella petrii]MDM9560793.1 endonuclease [Bordetella petrii]